MADERSDSDGGGGGTGQAGAEPGRVPALRIVDAPVVRVTLLEDRGHVVRRGRMALAAASERVRVPGLAPVASDKTLAVRVLEGDGVVVADARIRRRAVVRLLDGGEDATEANGDAAAASLEAERAELDRRRLALAAELDQARSHRDLLVQQLASLGQVAELSLADLAQDVAWGAAVGEDWAGRLDQLAAEEQAVADQVAEIERSLDCTAAELRRLDVRIAQLSSPADRETAELEVDLRGPAGAPVELEIEYVVPGACWRPQHTARLLEGAGADPAGADSPARARVLWSTDACVWQNTGEDWDRVELSFSTERSSLGTEPPELETDTLEARRKSDTVVVETREQDIDTAGLGGGGRRVAALAELPGIDDAGQAVTLRAQGASTIPCDGRPHRIPLFAFESGAELALVAFPELSAAVVCKTTLENRAAHPLLAGPVDLVRASGLVGKTQVLYVAPDERFELGWGPEPDLRVSREVHVHDETSRMLSAWHSRTTRVVVRISNLGGQSRQLLVTERVPVAEIEKVKVEVDARVTSERKTPDPDGFVRWQVELGPLGHRELELGFALRRHEDVVGV